MKLNQTVLFVLAGTVAGLALFAFGVIAFSGPSAADREIDQIVAENREAVLKKLRQIEAADQLSRLEMKEQILQQGKDRRPPERRDAEIVQRFYELDPRPNFDLGGPQGNAVVMPRNAIEEVKLALSGQYDRKWGSWYGPRGQLGAGIPKAAQLIAITPRPKKLRNGEVLTYRPDELKEWISLLMKVRYVLDYEETTTAANQASGSGFYGGSSFCNVRFFDVESGHCLGVYSIYASSSSEVSVSTVRGQDLDNNRRVESALANDLSAGMSGAFKVEFWKFFAWERAESGQHVIRAD